MTYYSKEGPNVQSQSEHTAYKKMLNAKSKVRTIQGTKYNEKDYLKAENEWLKEKMKTQARENGGWSDY